MVKYSVSYSFFRFFFFFAAENSSAFASDCSDERVTYREETFELITAFVAAQN